jgi:hypothetical protein
MPRETGRNYFNARKNYFIYRLTLNVRLIEKYEEKIISIHFLDQFFALITMKKKILKNFQYWVK